MKLFFALALSFASLAASAQGLPRVNIGRPCRVLMIDNWHRAVATYNGRIDILSRQCAKPMKECRRDLMSHRGPRGPRGGLRCVDERGRW